MASFKPWRMLRQRVFGAGFARLMPSFGNIRVLSAEKKDFCQYDKLPIVQKPTILHASAGSITFPETTWIPF
jgi:hypothetical protein